MEKMCFFKKVFVGIFVLLPLCGYMPLVAEDDGEGATPAPVVTGSDEVATPDPTPAMEGKQRRFFLQLSHQVTPGHEWTGSVFVLKL